MCCLLFAYICHQQIVKLYIHTQKNTRTYRGIKLKPSRAAPYCPVLYYPVPYHPVPFVSCRARSHSVLYRRVLSSPIASCPVLSGHVTLSPFQNSYLGVKNTHTQHNNLSVTTTSRTVTFVYCRVRSHCVLSCQVLPRPIVSCTI